MQVNNILQTAFEQGASDLHLCVGQESLMRRDGRLEPTGDGVVEQGLLDNFCEEFLSSDQISQLDKKGDVDCCIAFDFARARLNIYQQKNGLSLACRFIPEKVVSLQSLGLPSSIESLCAQKRGLILVTGPTGSGKSTTVASMIDYINTSRADHIITIEDPVEFLHTSKNSLVNQRQVFSDAISFNQALKAALREDPDVIFIGELRDLETIRLALTAAETGHLVLATLHTSSAAKTIDRVIDVFPTDEKSIVRTMLAESLVGVIAQLLLPRKDNKGRIAAHEVLLANHAVRNLIRENKVAQIISLMQTGPRHGMLTLEQDLKEKISSGLIDKEVARPFIETAGNTQARMF